MRIRVSSIIIDTMCSSTNSCRCMVDGHYINFAVTSSSSITLYVRIGIRTALYFSFTMFNKKYFIRLKMTSCFTCITWFRTLCLCTRFEKSCLQCYKNQIRIEYRDGKGDKIRMPCTHSTVI